MRTPEDVNYQRGYEWWLMLEAKKRNPAIKLYGLAWGWPNWVCANGTTAGCSDPFLFPSASASYITHWVSGALAVHGLKIDYIGTWNERTFNTTYIKLLRGALDAAGHTDVAIAAPDGEEWDIAPYINADADLAAAVGLLAAHYPGTASTPAAEATGKPLLASEDFSTFNNEIGAGCWAREINQNFVRGNMTGSIAWNLVAAYMKGTHWYRTGLMTAMSPWNGGYGALSADGTWSAGPMVWVTAHTTQFTQPGWTYLPAPNAAYPSLPSGSGLLTAGGSYVTLVQYDDASGAAVNLTIVIEKMSRNHSVCVRPGLAPYDTHDESALFALGPGLLQVVSSLFVWRTHWAFHSGDPMPAAEFEPLPPIVVGPDGTFRLNITTDSVYTLTSVAGGRKGVPPSPPPPPSLFPAAFTDDFDACAVPSEAPFFSDQNGAFECFDSGDAAHGITMRQSTPHQPLQWYDVRPHSFIGHRDTLNASLVVDAFIEEAGASLLLGLRMQGTETWDPYGLIWSLDTGAGAWFLHTQLSAIDKAGAEVLRGNTSVSHGTWHTYRMDANGSSLSVWVDGQPIISGFDVSCALPSCTLTGHAAIGTRKYGHWTQFDNFQLFSAFTQCGDTPLREGAPVAMVECNSEVGLRPGSMWEWSAGAPGEMVGRFSLRANSSLCMANLPNPASETWGVALALCNASDANQQWEWTFDGIAPDGEQTSTLSLPASGRCLDVASRGEIGAPADTWPCNGQTNQAMYWDFGAGEVGNQAYAVCLGVC